MWFFKVALVAQEPAGIPSSSRRVSVYIVDKIA